MPLDQIFLWSVVILLAVVGDLLLHRWLRLAWQKQGVNVLAAGAARVGGALASVLDKAQEAVALAGGWLQREAGRVWRLATRFEKEPTPAALVAATPSGPSESPTHGGPASDGQSERPERAEEPGRPPPAGSLSGPPPADPAAAAPLAASEIPTLAAFETDGIPEWPELISELERTIPAGTASESSPSALEIEASTPRSMAAPGPVGSSVPMVGAAGAPAAVVGSSATTVSLPIENSTIEVAGGLARVHLSVELPIGATIRLTIESGPGDQPTITQLSVPSQSTSPQAALAPAPTAFTGRPASDKPAAPAPARQPRVSRLTGAAVLAPLGQLRRALRARWPGWREALVTRRQSLPQVLFWASVGVYLITRLIGIDRYPIYFFTDEAVHTVLAADFVHAGLQNSDHELLPTYFSLGPSFNLNGVSVYVQTIPYLLFGKSEFVTRATSAAVTLIAAIAVGLILRDIFKRRYWWTATLLLAVTPAWFLHSRTAFEYIEVAAYYAGFLYFYLRYRYISPRSLYGAIFFAALAFYTHGLGEILVGLITLFLAVSDWRYHWQQRATIGRGLLFGLVLLLPFLRYSLAHSSATMDQLRQRGSYWVQDGLSLSGKLSQFFSEYAIAFNPRYWFLANNGRDIERHVMQGYGNLWLPTLPMLALGLAYAVRTIRSSMSRTVLLALVAAPVGSALVAVGMPRVLFEIIPIVVLSAVGLCLALEWLEDHRVPAATLALGAFVVLAGFNFYMLRDALVNGGRWTSDYTLAGTQFGARQVFGEAIPQYLVAHPDAHIIVSATWANGTEMFVPFFLTADQSAHVRLESLDYFVTAPRDLPPNLEVVLPAYEYDKAVQDPKLANIAVDKIIPYPNGKPGFYFLRLSYSPQAASLFAADEAALHQPVVEDYPLDGQTVTITHPKFGAGQLRDMLDGSPYTLINAPGFNPLVLDFAFPAARPMNGLTLITGSLPDFTVTATVYATSTAAPNVYSQRFVGLPPDPTINLNFGQGPSAAVRVRVEINNNADNGPGVNIHLRDVQFH